MRTVFADSGGEPLGTIIDRNEDYPEVSIVSNGVINIAERWMRELCCSGADGTVAFTVKDGVIRVTAPKMPSYVVADRADPLDVERAAAGFSRGPVWVGGLGEYEGPGIYWTESDRGLTHDMLMDACDGLTADERREAHRRADNLATVRRRDPTVRDLLTALHVVRSRRDDDTIQEPSLINVNGFCPVCMAELTSSAFDGSAVPSSGARVALHERYVWKADEPERSVVDAAEALEGEVPTTRDASLVELERMVQDADMILAGKTERYRAALKQLADGAEPDVDWAPGDDGLDETRPVGWTDSWGKEVAADTPGATPVAALPPTQEPQEAPNAAPLPDTAAASGTGSPASPAAPALDLETAIGADLDKIADKLAARRDHGEPDSSLRDALKAKLAAASDLSDCRWVNPAETASDPIADREDLARVAPALHRSADLSPPVWAGIAGSQSVEAGGRFNAVDISDAVND